MYPPTASAPLMPTSRAPEAVPRITLTSPRVRTASVSIATVWLTCEVGSVAPLMIPPYITCRNQAASTAPISWARI